MHNLLSIPADFVPPEPSALEELPPLLLALLERRYLSEFEASDWSLHAEASPGSVMLRELLAIGDAAATPMATTLAAWHEPGQAVITVVSGGMDRAVGPRHRVFYGARRGAGGPGSDAYLASQSATLAAHYSGIELSPARSLAATTELARFLRTAPALAAMTGIPAPLTGNAAAGLDRLARSIGARNYAIVVVAEPLNYRAADLALDACRHLQTDVSACMSRQYSRTRGESSSKDETLLGDVDILSARMPLYLQQCAGYVSAVTGQPILAALTFAASVLTDTQQKQPQTPTIRESRGTNQSESATYGVADAVARTCDEILASHASRIQSGRGWGWWQTAVYIAADSEATLQAVSRAVRATATGDASALEPLRLIRLPQSFLRNAIFHGQILGLRPRSQAPPHPLGAVYDSVATCLSSTELALLTTPPRQELPGIPLRVRGEFAVSLPAPVESAIQFGRTIDAAGAPIAPVLITARNLNEHVLITGTPGSGKTNTCKHLLLSADREFQVPFLVIEPAKAEYRQLQQQLGDRLRIYSIGGTSTLRLNPLAPVAGAPLLGHIDLLKAVFNASFSMLPGMPQILEQALIEVYQDRGWNLHTSRNEDLAGNTDPFAVAALTPNLEDLHDQVELVMQRKGYIGEARANLGAALRSRLNGLLLGSKGASLNVRRPVPDSVLFNSPVVLELQHLRDDDEKSFVIATIFMRLYQYCEVRQRNVPPHRREQLQHLTLIEEAHRLLAPSAAGENGNARGKSISMFTDMLAELRALGEGFLIADQVPTKLAPDTLKNTNLKIIHRLTAKSERLAAGQSANLTDVQIEHLANLPKGVAVIHGLSSATSELVAAPALVQVKHIKSPETATGEDWQPAPTAPELEQRHGGCRSCPAPCEFFGRTEVDLVRDATPGVVRQFAEATLTRDAERAWKIWSQWRALRSGRSRTAGEDYCWFVHAAREWLAEVLGTRAKAFSGLADFRPADRLLAEQLAASFGKVARSWLNHNAYSPVVLPEWELLANELNSQLQSDTSPSLAGCQECPARCRMLPFIAGADWPKVTAAIHQALKPAGSFATNYSVELRGQKLADELLTFEAPQLSSSTADPQAWGRDWKYCLLTNIELPPDADVYRQKALAILLRTKEK